MKAFKISSLAIIAIFIFLQSCIHSNHGQNCSKSRKAFENAKNTNTISSYQNFIENYCSCSEADSARKIIDSFFDDVEKKSSQLNGGQRWNFGDRYKNNISIKVTRNNGNEESVPADNIAQEDGLLLVQEDNNAVESELTQISICKRLVFKIPDTVNVNNEQWLLRKKEITINRIENGFVFPTDDSEVPSQSGLINGDFVFNYWNQAIGASWKFINKEKIKTNFYTYEVISTPAWINFTKNGIELINIERVENE
ncbi:MAG: hypothetical protein K9I94_00280 [Bacteroidales bacterium]|nr:hypothetical protein [Bacteroidales bacterium]